MRLNIQEHAYEKKFFLPNIKHHISSKNREREQLEPDQSLNNTIKYYPFYTDISIDINRKVSSPSRVISYKIVDSITSQQFLKKKEGEIKSSEKTLHEDLSKNVIYKSWIRNRSKSPVKLSYNIQKISNMIQRRFKTPTKSITPFRYAAEIGCQIDFD